MIKVMLNHLMIGKAIEIVFDGMMARFVYNKRAVLFGDQLTSDHLGCSCILTHSAQPYTRRKGVVERWYHIDDSLDYTDFGFRLQFDGPSIVIRISKSDVLEIEKKPS